MDNNDLFSYANEIDKDIREHIQGKIATLCLGSFLIGVIVGIILTSICS